jgi:hypothetical protein
MTDWVSVNKLRQRAKDVISSCKTYAQLRYAERYCELMSKAHPHTIYYDKYISDRRREIAVGF